MSEKNSFLGLGTYLKKVNDSFDSNKSLSDVLDSFRCISKQYQEFNSIDQTTRNYSDNNYALCSENEQKRAQENPGKRSVHDFPGSDDFTEPGTYGRRADLRLYGIGKRYLIL